MYDCDIITKICCIYQRSVEKPVFSILSRKMTRTFSDNDTTFTSTQATAQKSSLILSVINISYTRCN